MQRHPNFSSCSLSFLLFLNFELAFWLLSVSHDYEAWELEHGSRVLAIDTDDVVALRDLPDLFRVVLALPVKHLNAAGCRVQVHFSDEGTTSLNFNGLQLVICNLDTFELCRVLVLRVKYR